MPELYKLTVYHTGVSHLGSEERELSMAASSVVPFVAEAGVRPNSGTRLQSPRVPIAS